ncbi:group III truncated hemoglobin [Carboxylicivirga mesophila]|uniref:Group III truncated hemoglobin n=1 Tax=Carboxylicivirga mesophila TaxID=1166478 RepID=A0ABS5K623_9BACT|nr:group III truncated hemoglobin [Carboxylicivirga mesophila]MBS2210433.1 group III truncated hemoglobin [Carboxylicivirga mesophila]
MTKSKLQTRDNIEKLVRTFYAKVQKDDLLGPFFNQTIKTEEEWEKHYILLTDFWTLNLLDIKGFDGNPAKAHHGVDKAFKHSITTTHFDRWVKLWSETIDKLFEGEIADKAKMRAQNMAKGMYKKILDQRPGGYILPGNATDLKFG